MIQFEPPYKGTDKISHFALLCHGVLLVGAHVEAIVVDAEGDLLSVPLEQVNLDVRFDPRRRGFMPIDDPSTERGD
jgi:hypothetical protein